MYRLIGVEISDDQICIAIPSQEKPVMLDLYEDSSVIICFDNCGKVTLDYREADTIIPLSISEINSGKTFKIGSKEYGTVFMFGLLFNIIREKAEKYIDSRINGCVLCCPEKISYYERVLLENAMKMGGLDDNRVTSISAGICLGYWYQNNSFEGKILVVNRGSIYTEISVVEIDLGVVEVCASNTILNKEWGSKSGDVKIRKLISIDTPPYNDDTYKVLVLGECDYNIELDMERIVGGRISCEVVDSNSAAIGAAVQAAKLSGISYAEEIILLDCVYHTLSIKQDDSITKPIIENNVTIPTKEKIIVTTIEDNQETIKIVFCEEDVDDLFDNKTLKTVSIDQIRSEKAGIPQFEIGVEIYGNHDLFFTVKDINNSRKSDRNVFVYEYYKENAYNNYQIQDSRTIINSLCQNVLLVSSTSERINEESTTDEGISMVNTFVDGCNVNEIKNSLRRIMPEFENVLDSSDRDDEYVTGFKTIYNKLKALL